jgi:hypothetical protein
VLHLSRPSIIEREPLGLGLEPTAAGADGFEEVDCVRIGREQHVGAVVMDEAIDRLERPAASARLRCGLVDDSVVAIGRHGERRAQARNARSDDMGAPCHAGLMARVMRCSRSAVLKRNLPSRLPQPRACSRSSTRR